MTTCPVCKEAEGELECRGCGKMVCEDCLIGITSHNMVDEPYCKSCDEWRELQ